MLHEFNSQSGGGMAQKNHLKSMLHKLKSQSFENHLKPMLHELNSQKGGKCL